MAFDHQWAGVRKFEQRRPGYLDEVLDRIREGGPITAADLQQRTGPKGSWWSWDDGKLALEFLFHHGRLPRSGGAATSPASTTCRNGVLLAAALAALTPTGRGPHRTAGPRRPLARRGDVGGLDRLPPSRHSGLQAARRRARRRGRPAGRPGRGLAETGLRAPRRDHPRAVKARALLSPFDSLVWKRPHRASLRLLLPHRDLRPPPKRIHGYYVLPFLLDGELVGRVDLKADRLDGVLRVQAAYGERGVDETVVAGNPPRSCARWPHGWLSTSSP